MRCSLSLIILDDLIQKLLTIFFFSFIFLSAMYFRWVEQIIDFIEQVIHVEEQKEKGHQKNKIDDKEIKTTTSKKKVHLVGNSVGGHIAAHIARRRPDLISSICLLNPTPVRFL
jgi:predicted esterase